MLRDLREGFAFVRAHAWLWATLHSRRCSCSRTGGQEVLVPYRVRNELSSAGTPTTRAGACVRRHRR